MGWSPFFFGIKKRRRFHGSMKGQAPSCSCLDRVPSGASSFFAVVVLRVLTDFKSFKVLGRRNPIRINRLK